jgi:ribulose-5-phosphate 4-epimerase/fuculose-1-phosphate aldolase
LFQAGLIGVYPDGIGYGNISVRGWDAKTGNFIITGTQTGHKPNLTAADFSVVTDYDIARNSVVCEGPVAASSEAMTHAAVYELDSRIGAVIHVHTRPLWQQGREFFPLTATEVAYGTPAMAAEMVRLYLGTRLPEIRVLIMAGHEEGVIAFGGSLAEAYATLAQALQTVPAKTT